VKLLVLSNFQRSCEYITYLSRKQSWLIWGSQSGCYEEFFWDVISWKTSDILDEQVAPSDRIKQQTKHEIKLKILKIEARRSFETSIDIYWTTRRYIPEGRTLQKAKCFMWIIIINPVIFLNRITNTMLIKRHYSSKGNLCPGSYEGELGVFSVKH
jgi:hypothetical protein